MNWMEQALHDIDEAEKAMKKFELQLQPVLQAIEAYEKQGAQSKRLDDVCFIAYIA